MIDDSDTIDGVKNRVEKAGAGGSSRFMELEGLRAIAAITVVIYHYLIAFYAFAFFGPGTPLAAMPNKHFETVLHGSPLMVFLSGNFSVALFFVLSGFVLSIGFFQTNNENIIKKMAAKRYFRLMLPALASVLIAFSFIKLGLSNAHAASAITHSGWLAAQWMMVPHIFDVLQQALLGIFVKGGSPYNNVLWTMLVEFFGSFIVFGSLLLFVHSKHRWVLYSTLVVITFGLNPWLPGFVMGMLLADLYAKGILQQKLRNIWQIVGLLAVALFLGGYPYSGVEGTIYQFMMIGKANMLPVYTVLGATIVVGVVIGSKQVARVLAHNRVSSLGKYTFSLYLTHLLVLFSFTTFCFIQFSQHFGYNRAVGLALLVSVPVIVAVTVLFERFVDKPSVRFSGYIADLYLGNKEIALKKKLVIIKRYAIKRIKPIRSSPASETFPEPDIE